VFSLKLFFPYYTSEMGDTNIYLLSSTERQN